MVTIFCSCSSSSGVIILTPSSLPFSVAVVFDPAAVAAVGNEAVSNTVVVVVVGGGGGGGGCEYCHRSVDVE